MSSCVVGHLCSQLSHCSLIFVLIAIMIAVENFDSKLHVFLQFESLDFIAGRFSTLPVCDGRTETTTVAVLRSATLR